MDTSFRYKDKKLLTLCPLKYNNFILVLSAIILIYGITIGNEFGVALAISTIIFIILGIGMIVSGQVVTCFVSIERNTKATYELLKQSQKQY